MGLLGEGINEIIATTRKNAAPIGIIYRNEKYSAVLFHGSHTEENVLRDGWLVANIVYDPVLYVETAFGDLPESAFCEEVVQGKTVDRLCEAEAWVLFECRLERNTGEASVVSLMPVKEEVISAVVRPFNRGFAAVIDATVHATRYLVNRDPALYQMIQYNFRIIKKCGDTKEQEALFILNEIVKKVDS